MEKTWNGLKTWHSETLSAWTMVLAVLVSSYQCLTHISTPSLLVWLHVCLHAPFSIKYHSEHPFSTEEENLQNIKLDTKMIFVTHIILHAALNWNAVPTPISILSISLFAFIASVAIRDIDKATTTAAAKQAAIRFSWIFFIHYIPILLRGMHTIALIQFIAFVAVFGIYLCWNKMAISRTLLFKNINANNAFMHLGLVLNNLIAHFIVQGAI